MDCPVPITRQVQYGAVDFYVDIPGPVLRTPCIQPYQVLEYLPLCPECHLFVKQAAAGMEGFACFCRQHSTATKQNSRYNTMIPDNISIPSPPPVQDVMLTGYQQCATEALQWLTNLGYEPGHPLIRSLAAHLTKKQAYLEKLNLEKFLAMSVCRVDSDQTSPEKESHDLHFLKTDKEVQRALIEASYKGCNLHYTNTV